MVSQGQKFELEVVGLLVPHSELSIVLAMDGNEIVESTGCRNSGNDRGMLWG